MGCSFSYYFLVIFFYMFDPKYYVSHAILDSHVDIFLSFEELTHFPQVSFDQAKFAIHRLAQFGNPVGIVTYLACF